MNEEQRCESREPQPEGINQDKMDLIESRYGARWEQIDHFPRCPGT